jgi:hypothetical protein
VNGADERRAARSNVVLTGTIEFGGRQIPARVRNVSVHGALVTADDLPPEDAEVTLRLKGMVLQSWIAWARHPEAGIQFGTPVTNNALLKKAPAPHQVVMRDERVVDYRRPGFRGNQLTEEQRKIVDEWIRAQQAA